ncbi:MAG: exodeoxyribonuclease V subunit beta [Desulfococcaceae bacterium]|jgi:exodeoxyribonuclease V beta subunit|nr:exodeoxyribonuclease V subunit beta [Desulfococcaceae bacterium]
MSSPTFRKLDLPKLSLEGSNLIEASAGTGKTYTIEGLYLRLILEKKDMTVDKILVVTYTEAATAELKERIRNKLRDAAAVFAGQPTQDPFLQTLQKNIPNIPEALRLIRNALRDFDESGIFTIHAFCMRMLKDHAFESGALFDMELLSSQENMLREIVEDFWRIRFYSASPLFVRYAIDKTGPDDLMTLLGNRVSQPDLRIIPQIAPSDPKQYEADFIAAFRSLAAEWQASRYRIEKIFLEAGGLKNNSYKPEKRGEWLQSMADYLEGKDADSNLFDAFDRFCASTLDKFKKKGKQPPSHPFFDRCDDFFSLHTEMIRVFEQHLLHLKSELFAYARKELKERKERRNLRSFDDLLTDLRDALKAEGGEKLIKKIRGKYKAALIDEFQDTDPVQYEIFHTLFHHEDSILFLIGDPKQAIYAFRGADIFAYMQAAEQSAFRYTLDKNWRSEPGLIAAVNTLFHSSRRAFVYKNIPFLPVEAPEKENRKYLTFEGKKEPPLQIWLAESHEDILGKNKLILKEKAEALIANAVSAEISRLLHLGREKRVCIGERGIGAGDIAVLVRKHAQADQIRAALACLDIPAILHSRGDVFDSPESLELERLLAALEEPGNENLIRTALAGDMLGLCGEELEALGQDEDAWEKWLLKFADYGRSWKQKGFIRMFRQFLSTEEVLPRLMALPDGERRCTNLLHLSELLHRADTEKKTGTGGLLKWLSEHRRQRDRREEETPLRLESDANAVKLVTMHKSKGLQYPVVFCPFTWNASKPRNAKNGPVFFHDEKDGKKLTMDLGSDALAENSLAEGRENLAENLRLLYVALTRAQHRCYLVWGRFSTAETSAPAWLFHTSSDNTDGDILTRTAEAFKKLEDPALFEAMENLAKSSSGNIAVSPLPSEKGIPFRSPPAAEEILQQRSLKKRIADSFRVSSFSSLVMEKPYSTEISDSDAAIREVESISHARNREEETAEINIFSFPRGSIAGTCLHEIFENLDFTENSETERMIGEKLEKYGIETHWTPVLQKMTADVLSLPLSGSPQSDAGDFSLSGIRQTERINELEFYFPLKSFTPRMLQKLFEKAGINSIMGDFPRQIGKLRFSASGGFMRGFIDLVFCKDNRYYLLDWKSNYLGDRPEDYHKDLLARTMREEYYILQYHIYSLALHRYLKIRIPDYVYEKHFGGVYYLFLRGIDPAAGKDFGVFQDRPAWELIREMELLFCG